MDRVEVTMPHNLVVKAYRVEESMHQHLTSELIMVKEGAKVELSVRTRAFSKTKEIRAVFEVPISGKEGLKNVVFESVDPQFGAIFLEAFLAPLQNEVLDEMVEHILNPKTDEGGNIIEWPPTELSLSPSPAVFGHKLDGLGAMPQIRQDWLNDEDEKWQGIRDLIRMDERHGELPIFQLIELPPGPDFVVQARSLIGDVNYTIGLKAGAQVYVELGWRYALIMDAAHQLFMSTDILETDYFKGCKPE